LKKIWICLFVAAFFCPESCRRDGAAELPQVIDRSAQEYYRCLEEAAAARGRRDHLGSLEAYLKALAVMPSNPRLMYEAARLNALLGRNADAIRLLDKALTLGYGTMAENDPDLHSLQGLREFQALREKIDAAGRPVHTSTPAFALPEKDLIPEGITYDPVEEVFYLGSTYKCKIIKVDKFGLTEDFTSEKQDGLRTVLGLKVDPGRRILWANSTVTSPPPRGVDLRESGWSAVFKYDLDTGRLLKKYILHEEGKKHLFNDLAVGGRGSVFITDSEAGAIYAILPETDELILFLAAESFIYPNGIAISPDDRTLYVAHLGGMIRIDLETRAYRPVAHPTHITLYGIDGLYWYRNSLVAIQNGLNRVVRLFADHSGLGVDILEILEANNPALDIPTTGVIIGDEFYYIANAVLSTFQEDGTLALERLKDIVIMKTAFHFPVSQRFVTDRWIGDVALR